MAENLRVLILTIWYPNEENPILGTFVHEQAVALRDAGVAVRIVHAIPFAPFPITLFKDSYRKLSALPKQTSYGGFEIYHPRYLTLPAHVLFENVGDWMFATVGKTIKRLHEEWPFEVIHAHTTFPCGYAANRIRDKWVPEVKVVHTIHRTCIVDAPNYNPRCFKKVRSSLEGANGTVFVSLEGQRLASEYTGGRIAAKSHYITNGVDTAKFALTPDDNAEVAALKSRHSQSFNLVFVGYLNERKGIKELLSAINNLVAEGRRNLKLFLVGRNELGDYVDSYLQTHGLTNHVERVGSVLHYRIKIWMNFADAFILPSHSEGLPTVLFESLYSGAPSIFTRVGGVSDVVVDGEEALLIPAGSVGAIEAAITRLIDDAALRERLSAKGHALIRDQFTWAINAKQHVELYRQLLSLEGR